MAELLQFARDAKAAWEEDTKRTSWSQRVFVAKDKTWSGSPLRNTRTWDNIAIDAGEKKALREDLDTFLESEKWWAPASTRRIVHDEGDRMCRVKTRVIVCAA